VALFSTWFLLDNMILTHDVITAEIAKGNIKIEPLLPDQVGPASVDLHLGNSFRKFIRHDGIFSVTNEADFETITETLFIAEGEQLLIKPGETLLGVTREQITLGSSLCGWIEGRSRFARIGLGVHISSSFIQPGISNHQVLEITNLGPTILGLMPGVRICQFIFQRCEGQAEYKGKFSLQNRP
jgi:dCTP deaminase